MLPDTFQLIQVVKSRNPSLSSSTQSSVKVWKSKSAFPAAPGLPKVMSPQISLSRSEKSEDGSLNGATSTAQVPEAVADYLSPNLITITNENAPGLRKILYSTGWSGRVTGDARPVRPGRDFFLSLIPVS